MTYKVTPRVVDLFGESENNKKLFAALCIFVYYNLKRHSTLKHQQIEIAKILDLIKSFHLSSYTLGCKRHPVYQLKAITIDQDMCNINVFYIWIYFAASASDRFESGKTDRNVCPTTVEQTFLSVPPEASF